MRLALDEHLSPAIAASLVERGVDALELTLTEVAGANSERDIERLRFALENNHLLPEDF